VADGLAFVADLDGTVYGLDAWSGAVRWRLQAGGEVVASPAVVDDILYVAASDRLLYRIDAASGFLTGVIPVGSDSSSPVVTGGVLYIGVIDGVLALPGV
jgi:eukaryotic-like serine/threonine-protein kinase